MLGVEVLEFKRKEDNSNGAEKKQMFGKKYICWARQKLWDTEQTLLYSPCLRFLHTANLYALQVPLIIALFLEKALFQNISGSLDGSKKKDFLSFLGSIVFSLPTWKETFWGG